MEFVADESCDFAVVRALRTAGHDVRAVAEFSPQIPDDTVLAIAQQDKRVLLTEDKDFGELVYAQKRRSSGVVLLRFPGNARATMASAVVHTVASLGKKLAQRFTVIEPGRIRSRRSING